MSSVPTELRGQANAISVFFMHLLGDFPSPFLIGVFNEELGMEIGMMVTFIWLYLGAVAWYLAYNTGVISIQRFLGKFTFC